MIEEDGPCQDDPLDPETFGLTPEQLESVRYMSDEQILSMSVQVMRRGGLSWRRVARILGRTVEEVQSAEQEHPYPFPDPLEPK